MSRIRPADIIRKHYSDNPQALQILLDHSRLVTRRALKIGRYRQSRGDSVDLQFLAEAAMLHDIGIFQTDSPEIGCFGKGPYIQHGIKGKLLLEQEGLPRHARVCERHIGVGLTAEEIHSQRLPLPERDMCPETLEEQIICYADLFYSKGLKNRNQPKNLSEIRKKLKKYGKSKIHIFDQWVEKFEPDMS